MRRHRDPVLAKHFIEKTTENSFLPLFFQIDKIVEKREIEFFKNLRVQFFLLFSKIAFAFKYIAYEANKGRRERYKSSRVRGDVKKFVSPLLTTNGFDD